MFYNFLWGGSDKIKRNVAINDIEYGGLKMIDIQSYFEGIKASWVSRYLNENSDWSVLMEEHLTTIYY